MSKDDAKIAADLEARLEALKERLAEINQTLRQPEDDDFEEQAVEIDADDVLERLARAGKDEVQLIGAALKRIEDGTYGTCLTCGNKISEGRLRALPEAVQCMPCAQRSGS